MNNPSSKDLPVIWQILVVVAMIFAFVVFAFFHRLYLAGGIFAVAVLAAWIKGLTLRKKES